MSVGELLLDLLTREEEAIDLRTREFRFDISLLARRLVAATDWAGNSPATRALPLAFFGASTGAAAALVAAAARPGETRFRDHLSTDDVAMLDGIASDEA